jgi:radical SAM superfamily enzyme YgiQ (UPF0313 family)
MKNVYFIQPAMRFDQDHAGWIPYSVGCIWAYANQFDFVKNNFKLKEIVFRRELHDDIINRLENPSVIGFSCYVWNARYNLSLAEKIKNKWPNCIIVVGGPQANSTWTKYRFIDSIILAEGESTFTKIFKTISEGGQIDLFYNERLKELDVPSPYTTGVFDDIVKNNPDLYWYMVMESTRGCPYSCTFCDWGGGIYSKVRKYNLEKVEQEINWAINNKVAIVLMPDANFGIFKERDMKIAKMLRAAADHPNSSIQQIQFTYAKNTSEICFEIEKVIGPYSNGLSVSVQTMNKGTLEATKRSIMKLNDLEYVFSLSKKYDVRTYTELILGLPEETVDDFKDGITRLLELGQHTQIYVWIATVLPNSEMGQKSYLEKYGIKTQSVKNYKDQNGYELTEFVVGTNSMSFEDLIESYMYAWVIQNFHHTGFSEIISKYCRNVKDMSYREFYDRLFKAVQLDEFISPIFFKFKNSVVNYLTTGDNVQDDSRFLITLDCDIEKYYEHKDKFVSATVNCFKEMLSDDIIEIQKIYNVDSNNNFTRKFNINLETWEEIPTTYHLYAPTPPEGSNKDFYDLSLFKHLNKRKFEII